MSLLEQDIIRKRQVNNSANETLQEPKKKFEARENKKYKVKASVNNTIYNYKIENHLPGFYYLVTKKSNTEEKIIRELLLVVIYI